MLRSGSIGVPQRTKTAVGPSKVSNTAHGAYETFQKKIDPLSVSVNMAWRQART